MSEVFDELYSEYYDLLYKNKNYFNESQFVLDTLNSHSSSKVNSILELGCGTGGHATHWLPKIESWTGVDLSSSMLGKCRRNLKLFESKISLVETDITKLSLNKKFDGIVSLFHVASYQDTNEKLDDFFRVASEHMKEGSIFAFDFWHGTAVLTDKPKAKLLEVSNDHVRVTRFTNPHMIFSENIVKVDFKVWIDSLKTKDRRELFESHRMRFLFATEINFLAAKHDLKLLQMTKWLSGQNLDDTAWYGFAVLTK